MVVRRQEDRLRLLVEKIEKLRYYFLWIFAVNMSLIDVIKGDLSKLVVKSVMRHQRVEMGPDMNFLSYTFLATFSII